MEHGAIMPAKYANANGMFVFDCYFNNKNCLESRIVVATQHIQRLQPLQFAKSWALPTIIARPCKS